ncbi:hypothetical protein PUN28_009308 [Cardiocondyla obscurior]|uniref:H15 domain-containing protein n=1 Tax=Cardiocondyla obscurior TaxID=286306 RepID=A0AAW2FTJ7_9HYME
MARRAALVYHLLRTEQPPDGFSTKEILTRVSDKYDIALGKTLRRDVAIALRRGLDFGILAKKRNKFRFDPGFHQTTNLKRNIVRRKADRGRTKNRKGKSKKATGRSNAAKGRRQQRRQSRSRNRDRKQSNPVPCPKLPTTPPSWSPKRRLLIEEPIPRVKRVQQ